MLTELVALNVSEEFKSMFDVVIQLGAILAVVGMIHFRLNNYKDKIRTRMLFEIFSVLALAAIVFMILQPQHIDYLLALLIVSPSPMIGHYIALTNTFITNISFYVMLVVALIITCVNLWIPF